jgi:hypothetical protein
MVPVARPLLSTLSLLACAAALSAGATAGVRDEGSGGDDEVRLHGSCSRTSTWELRLKADDDAIETRFRLTSRRGARWTVLLLHERQIAARATVTVPRGGGSFDVRRDWYGTETVTVRATSGTGERCRASATL